MDRTTLLVRFQSRKHRNRTPLLSPVRNTTLRRALFLFHRPLPVAPVRRCAASRAAGPRGALASPDATHRADNAGELNGNSVQGSGGFSRSLRAKTLWPAGGD